ncbi:MAG: SagB/ThcOx family dehydrogenase [Chloroflexota bacterium]
MSTYRQYLKNQAFPGPSEMVTDQQKGLPIPPIQKPYPQDAALISLTPPEKLSVSQIPLVEAIRNRRSRRVYSAEPLSLDELAFLLWATQGVHQVVRSGLLSLRTVPSGGGMHPYETYLLVNRVEGLVPGLYRYISLEHSLLKLAEDPQFPEKLVQACQGQDFVGNGAVTFIWSARPYRTEWRNGEDSLKEILLGVGHICQNLYLACEDVGAGTSAFLSYRQDLLDELIGVDGEEEIALYLAPVGKVATIA